MTEAPTRRQFLSLAALGLGGSLLTPPAVARVRKPEPVDHHLLKLGVASFSLRQMSRDEAIAMVKALRTPYVNIKSFHLPYETSATERAAARAVFEDAGLTIVGGGTITLHKDTDEDVGKYFTYAKESGMPLMVIAPKPEVLPRIERFVKQFDIQVAIHNHGPEDPYFPGPKDALALIQDMDPRVGLCVDVGHTARTGVDVVEAVAEAGDRVLDMHMKDLRDLTDRSSQCIVGEGAIPIAALFRQLMQMDYQGYVNLEYEIDADAPLPGMQRSFAYMRGVLDGLATP